jgi:transcriptional regulator with XRE-family HTH domain
MSVIEKWTAQQIKELRYSLGLTQRQFAKLLHVTQATVNWWEAGKYEPSNTAKMLLASVRNNRNLDTLDILDTDFTCPLCGAFRPLSALDKEHKFEVYGRENGQRVLKQIGYEKHNAKLNRKAAVVVEFSSTTNGCDYYPDCRYCQRQKKECPDQQRGLAQKMEKADRADKVATLYADGWEKQDIAKEFGICERTVRRDLKKAGGK